MQAIMIILSVLSFAAGAAVCRAGIRYAQSRSPDGAQKRRKSKSPERCNAMKGAKAPAAKQSARAGRTEENDQLRRIGALLANVEAYDGTRAGQKKLH